jgi:transketolase
MRNAFIDELVVLARQHPHIALIVGDLGYSVIEPFAEEFPDRFVNAGVAEQNMTGVAAGMASEGYHVFTYSIGNFPTFRCAEQIRNDVDYHQLPVTVVSVGGGLAYGSLGYSHHAVQDYALLRAMPNMLIAAPGDPLEVRACLRYLVSHPQPSYLRLNKAGEPNWHKEVPEVSPGVWLKVHHGNCLDAAFLTTGATLALAMEWKDKSPYEGYSVISLPLWGLKQKTNQTDQVARYSKLVTVEDHLLDCGFGSWLLESLINGHGLLDRINIRALDSKVCGTVGTTRTLNTFGGLHN